MLGICCTYTSSRFNFYFIKPVTLKLHDYNSLEKIIIRKVENHFIKRLNIIIIHCLTSDSDPCWAHTDYSLYTCREKTLFEKTP